MLAFTDSFVQSFTSLRAHRLRTALTVVGLTMGVATLITVMTIVQGANLYVEQKIANLGTNVFQVARTPFLATDMDLILKALKNKHIERDDYRAVRDGCGACAAVGASGNTAVQVRYGDEHLSDVTAYGHTENMADIDTRTFVQGRYFTRSEEERGALVVLIGDTVVQRLFAGKDPIGRTVRVANGEYTVIGVFEKIGSVLGQDQDAFVVMPLSSFLRIRPRYSLTINVLAYPGERSFQEAQDQVTMMLRTRRHVPAGSENTFFIGTKDSYMALWQQISGAFFAVFILVSSISAVVGGIVIMNVMLVSVTERTKEIGVRRAMGATKLDVIKQFLTESVMQCIVGGLTGVAAGFAVAMLLRNFTAFPASVQTWVALLGVVLSSLIGLFFGIYPAIQASNLDPIAALRSD